MTPAQQWMQLFVSCLLSLPANWHAFALQGVSVPGIASEANVQRPSDPGCYVQMPNGCPKNPQFEATTWKHDRAGESTMRATRNRTVCEVVRRNNFMKWCGIDDVNMVFVQEVAEEPTEPGCYVRAPTECPRQPTFEPNYWKRDKQGEDTTDAGFNEGTCMDRREKFNKWCGVIDMEMRFIAGQTGWGTSADGSSDVSNAADAQAAQARARERELRRADPAFPGCYVQAPTSCPKQDAFAVGDWKRDKYGEMNKEAGNSEDACQKRKGSFDTWCGVTDTIMRFIPPGAEKSVDNSPGCYVMLPSQCPKQPTFIVGRWKRDKYGESNKDALLREDACMMRKSGFDSYCGTTNAIMRFVPGPNSILSSEDSVNTGADPTGGLPTGAEFPQDYSNPMGQPYGGMQPYGMPPGAQPYGMPPGMQPYGMPPGMQPYGMPNGMQPYGMPAGMQPFGGAPGGAPRGVDDGTNAPGCYVMVPKSCPKQPGFLAGTWKRDKYGEENKDAKTDPAACQARKSSFDRFCGTDDAIMKFVPPGGLPQQQGFDGGMVPGMPMPGGLPVPPQQLRPLDPALPGCYVQAPTACPKQPDNFLVGHWKRDTYGEAKIGAGSSEAACVARKASFDMWCGVRDVLMRYIPLGAEIGLDTTPGCFILVPSTCPKQPTFSIGRWKRDKFGESNKEAGIKEDACIERKQSFDAFCGITNTIVRFVPGPDAILSTQAPVPAPGSGAGGGEDAGPPGCYVKAPSTCPKQDQYKINEWKRDNYGEEHKGAAASLDACNARKASFDEWCGVSDMVMKFTPFAGADDAPGCYVLLPSACPKQSKFQVSQWKRDKFGEDNRKAAIEEDACRARKGSFDSFCGVKNAIMRFVPGPNAIMSKKKEEDSGEDGGEGASAPGAAPAKADEDEKGCFVKVTACPRQPTFQINTWKRDKYGEDHGGKTDESACQKRKASFDKYCGVEDAEMRFTGPDGKTGSGASSSASASATPAIQPGCYVKAPTSCPAHPMFKTGVWKRDVHGEMNSKAGLSLDACNSRKASFDKFCGVDNMLMRFVPVDGSSSGEEGSSGGDQALGNQVREDPAESPGCYYIAPSWCPKNRAFVAGTWYRDAHVAVTANATLGEEMCSARVDIYNKMCGVVDVRTRFVPPRPVRPTSFPEDKSKTSTELPPEPTKPGCYVAAPTECPSDASFSVRKWKHDTYGETMRDAAANRTACEQRKLIFDNFCGATDMVMRFVPRSEETIGVAEMKRIVPEEPMPEEPGCHVKAPTACPLEEEFPVGIWKHDTYGEAMTRAAFDKSICETDRKDFFVRWCGAPDIETYFVPAAEPEDPSQASGADEELPPAVLPPERTRTGVMPSPETAVPKRSFQEPGSKQSIAPHSPDYLDSAPLQKQAGPDGGLEPGCYIRAPTKCPLRPSFTVGEWKHDAWAEENMNALVDRVACHRRKANFDRWCGTEDIEVRHIGSMEEQAPREPGCYIFAPDGCPRQPFFRVATWVHDKYGEVMQRAGSSKTVCEQERRRVFAKWCGSDDLKMKFVPNA